MFYVFIFLSVVYHFCATMSCQIFSFSLYETNKIIYVLLWELFSIISVTPSPQKVFETSTELSRL